MIKFKVVNVLKGYFDHKNVISLQNFPSEPIMVPNRIAKLQYALKVFEIMSPISVTWQKQ